jgi:HPt (histidine-containing phosphotransfer) domain-containing protein
LELQHLYAVFNGELDRILPLLEKYLRLSQAEMQSIVDACSARDFLEGATRVHRLRGSALSVGAVGVASSCAEMEASLKTHDWASVEQRLGRLQHQHKIVDSYINKLLQRRSTTSQDIAETANA